MRSNARSRISDAQSFMSTIFTTSTQVREEEVRLKKIAEKAEEEALSPVNSMLCDACENELAGIIGEKEIEQNLDIKSEKGGNPDHLRCAGCKQELAVSEI